MLQQILKSLSYVITLPIASITVNRPTVHKSDGYITEGNPQFSVSQRSWGQYSPWFGAPSEIQPDIPHGCNVVTVQVLSRHGSRFPTQRASDAYKDLINRIHQDVQSYGEGYAFLEEYEYSLGAEAENLTPFGRRELEESGRRFYNRYRQFSSSSEPFVRSSGFGRVFDSAEKWTQGYHEEKLRDKLADSSYPYPIQVVLEEDDQNNTLHHGLCEAFENRPYSDIAHSAQMEWSSYFAKPIRDRVNSNLPGANLSIPETISLMDLCPFNTVATLSGAIHPFCDLFSPQEWQQYDYYQSLGKFYGYGGGNPLGPTQGVGYVNEVIARLTHRPVKDHTTVNHTLDNNPNTFPLDRPLYVDFGHDNEMTSILFALGLYSSLSPLSNHTLKGEPITQRYSAAYTVPFAARVYIEKLKCRDAVAEMVRVIVNDRVMPLESCGGDEKGRCTSSRFVKSLSFAKKGGRWDLCFK